MMRRYGMNESPLTLTIDRNIEDIKAQVKREIETIRQFCDMFGYRNSPPEWNLPYELHRLRRAMRMHYIALKIRASSPTVSGATPLAWQFHHHGEF